MRRYFEENPKKYEAHKRRVNERARRVKAEDPAAWNATAARHQRERRAADPSVVRNDRRRARERARLHVNAIKEGTPCADCGGVFDSVCMDFDHLGDDKTASIGLMVSKGMSTRRIDEEIAKCELVCANCHRVRTHRLRGHRGRARTSDVTELEA